MSSERQPLLPQHNQDGQSRAQQAYQSINHAITHPRQTADRLTPSQDTQHKIAYVSAAIQAGKLPSQQQINGLLERIKKSPVLKEGSYNRTGALSDQSARIVGDLKRVIEQIQVLGESKNSDNKIQDFIWNTSRASLSADTSSLSSLKPSQRQAREDTDALIQSIRTVGYLLITDKSLHSILNDLILSARDLFADAASAVSEQAAQAAKKARPSEQEREAGAENTRKHAKDPQSSAQLAKKKADELRREYRSGVHKQIFRQQADRAKSWIDEKTPDDPKDVFVERVKKIITSVQANDDYHEAMSTIVHLVKKWGRTAIDKAQQATEEVDVESNEHLDEAIKNLRSIIETFANGKSLDPLIDSVKKIYDDVKEDERLSNFWNDIDAYVERLLFDEGYVTSSKASRQADELYEKAQKLLETNAGWKRDAQALNEQLREYGDALSSDEETTEFLDALQDLNEDLAELLKDGASIFALNALKAPGAIADVFDVWLPRLIGEIKSIPLPRCEYKSAEIDFVLDNMRFESVGASFIPDRIKLVNHNELELVQGYAAFAATGSSHLQLTIEGVRVHAKDVAYYLDKKTGWGWKDWGFVDVDIGGDKGATVTVELETADEKDHEHYYKVLSVDVNTNTFTARVHNTHKPIANTFLFPFARPALRKLLQNALEETIRDQIADLDGKLHDIHQRSIALAQYSYQHGTAPSVTGYLKGLFSSSFLPSKSRTSASLSKRGIVKKGKRGEYLLAIGVSDHLLPGVGGPDGYYKKKAQEALEETRRLGLGLVDIKQAVTAQSKDVKREARRLARKEASKDTWHSEAFDILI
ncbi:hypothetical protein OC861_006414 [Tilletia horrida]|nr:hypothetical protein OC845_005199 [Tilletia horrida]KAK0560087.1 hypothetical protein OC861_006414 [Tilletia horrida]